MPDLLITPSSAGGRLHAWITRLSGQSISLTDGSLLAELERVIGLTDAIQLHGLLKDRTAVGQKVETEGAVIKSREPSIQPLVGQLRDDLLSTRQSLLSTLAEACGGNGADNVLRWPNLDVVVGLDGLTPVQRLERFYIRFQQLGQVRIQELRQRSRKKIAPILPRLAELDSWLEQALAPHLEKGLAVIPRQLARHCGEILAGRDQAASSDEPPQMSPTGQEALRIRACSLFIAETDVRLEPVLGLMEALEDIQRTD